MNTQENNKNRTQAEIRILQRTFNKCGKVYELRVIYKVDVLIGFDSHGLKIYKPKKKEQVFYGCSKLECNNKLKVAFKNEPVQYKKRTYKGVIIYA